jgi:DNA-binding protein HU-beta
VQNGDMNRSQVVAAVGGRLGDQDAGDAALTAFCDVVAETVAHGERVKLDGFGVFHRVQRPARGAVPATYVPRFDADPAFRDAVAGWTWA